MQAPFSPLLQRLGVGLAMVGVIVFLVVTPGGLLRKADYISAAVCHRRLSHSFVIDGHQSPLCQRCTGTFPGALTGAIVQWVFWKRRRSLKFPRWTFFVPVFLFAAMWGLDGINSTTADSQFYALSQRFIARPLGVGILGYAPAPWLRLLTGTLMGMSMSIVLVPAFNQSLWSDGEATPTLRNWHEFALLIAVELGLAGLVTLLVALPSLVAVYAVSIYSMVGVLTMFTLLGAMMFCLLLHKDASLAGWRTAVTPLIWGFVFALFMVALMDQTRLWLTGTIDGVPGLP